MLRQLSSTRSIVRCIVSIVIRLCTDIYCFGTSNRFIIESFNLFFVGVVALCPVVVMYRLLSVCPVLVSHESLLVEQSQVIIGNLVSMSFD